MGTTTAFPTLVGFRVVAVALAVMALIALVVGQADAGHLTGVPATYTLDADFDEGTLINVVHVPSDQLQLSNTTSAFNFIWVAVSTKVLSSRSTPLPESCSESIPPIPTTPALITLPGLPSTRTATSG